MAPYHFPGKHYAGTMSGRITVSLHLGAFAGTFDVERSVSGRFVGLGAERDHDIRPGRSIRALRRRQRWTLHLRRFPWLWMGRDTGRHSVDGEL